MLKILVLSASVVLLCSAGQLSYGAPRKQARPGLIVPGYSIGKVFIGQRREEARRKIGAPTQSFVRSAAVRADNSSSLEKVTVTEDVWKRQVKKSKVSQRWDRSLNELRVVYYQGRVVKMQLSLDGYKTKDGLSLESYYHEFVQRYGKGTEYTQDNDPDPPAGLSHAVESLLDFEDVGLAIEAETFAAINGPSSLHQLWVYKPGDSYSFY